MSTDARQGGAFPATTAQHTEQLGAAGMGSSNMSELRTSDSLLQALQKAAGRKLTAKEILEQRVSFVFGSIDSQSDVTRERVREVLMQQQGVVAK